MTAEMGVVALLRIADSDVDHNNRLLGRGEVPVTVRSADTTVTQRVRIPGRGKVVQRILIQGKPTEVQLNDGTVPESQASIHITNLANLPAAPPKASIPH